MTGSSSLEALTSRVETLRTELAAFETRVSRISMARLAVFLGAAVAVGLGLAEPNALLFGVGAAGFLVFFALVAYHGRVDEAESLVRARLDVCLRHLKRLGGTFTEFKRDGALLLPADHAYAHDIDLVGPGSLFQWIDTTHTTRGERTLLKWLGGGANTDEIRERQEAVRELAELGAFRETLEAELARRAEKLKLDPSPFLEFVGHRALFLGNLPATALLFLLPVGTIGCLVGAMLRVVPPSAWVVFVVLQIVLYLALGGRAHHAFDLVAARRGYVDAFYRAFCAIETTSFTAPRLEALKRRFFVSGDAPSKHFRSLDTWAGLAEVRRQFPLNLVLNALLLWDFHVLLGLERWNARAGRGLESLFDALGELEALASLATLPALDPSATFPEIVTDKPTFEATGLAHPLLPAEARVANDLTVTGQGSVVVVTGSNMAGKSTLLRSVGLNIALGLAGGAVVATSLRLSPVRLRASMRAADSSSGARATSTPSSRSSRASSWTRTANRPCSSSSTNSSAVRTPRPATSGQGRWSCTWRDGAPSGLWQPTTWPWPNSAARSPAR